MLVTIVDSHATLRDCLNHIKLLTVLAFGTEGVDLGRLGELTLMQISSAQRCFLLDMLSSVRQDIIAAIGPTLEDPDVTKVIHDCRCGADALYRLCSIRLRGVHDTQVWQRNTTKPHRPSLTETLRDHNIPIDRTGEIFSKFPGYWATRPLTMDMQKRASTNVEPLLQLRDMQIRRVRDARDQSSGTLWSEHEYHTLSETGAAMGNACCTKLHLHNHCIGAFIGRRGETIGQFEQQHGVNLFGRSRSLGSGVFLLYTDSIESLNRVLSILRSKGWLKDAEGISAV